MAKTNKLLVWGLIAAGASCGLCGLGTLAIMALGLSTDDGR
ncbi:hypothetical protein [Hyalangium sp.]|nr:hypothetical protein [Hyalangium sp.]HYH96669.1 hypothetical protein [Hyalangium sp.]